MDTTLLPAIVRARTRRGGLFAAQASFGSYLADKGFASSAWEPHWRECYGALVAPTIPRRFLA